MESNEIKLMKGKKVLGILIALSAITMMIYDFFNKSISFNTGVLIIALCIAVIIMKGGSKKRDKELNMSPNAEKILRYILILVIVAGIITAFIVS